MMNHPHDKGRKHTFTRDGAAEEVALEKWAWEAEYRDGTILRQFEDDGTFRQIGSLDMASVGVFRAYRTDSPHGRIDILIPEGAKPIFKYRNYVLNMATPAEQRIRIPVAGLIKANGEKILNFIMPDGNVVQTDTDDVALTGT